MWTFDPTTASVILRIVVPNPEEILLPGMFVRAIIEEGVDAEAILVPQQAVSRDQKGNPLALVIDTENKIQQRSLTTNRALGDKWLISSGLAPGDRLVVEGMQKVRPGVTAKAVPFAEGQPHPTTPGSRLLRSHPQYEGAVQSAFREVADALAVSGTVDQQVAAQESRVHALAETYRLSNARYDKGIDSYLSVLDAQRSLFAAQQELVVFRLEKLANQVRLYAVLGGGLLE